MENIKTMNSIPLQLRAEHYQLYCHNKFIATLLGCINYKRLYFPCLEVSLTTFCSLCCEKCANLMQYYSKPYHVEAKKVFSSIRALAKASDGIDCLRLIGGEPLLWPYLAKLIDYAITEDKIKGILIVTNGTMALSDELCQILSKSSKCKVSISNYHEKSKSIAELVKQLKTHHIKYVVRDVIWKDKADVSNRHKSIKQLINAYHHCPNRFFSLLNGELHMCPRSAHGSDLGVFHKRAHDYVNVFELRNSPQQLRQDIINMLKNQYIIACNYCAEDISDQLPIIETAKQCTKIQAQIQFSKMARTQRRTK